MAVGWRSVHIRRHEGATGAALLGGDDRCQADVTLYSTPTCVGDWAIGIAEDLTGTDLDVVFTDVFHVVAGQWSHVGQFFLYDRCDEGLLTSGMPRDVARQLVPDDTCTAGAATGSGSSAGPLREGDVGGRVERLQVALRDQVDPAIVPDGEFGPATEQAVEQLQMSKGLEVDGIAGPATFAALGVPYS